MLDPITKEIKELKTLLERIACALEKIAEKPSGN